MSTLVPTICAACAELLVSPAINDAHENMVREESRGTPDSSGTTRYRCLECDSIWELQYRPGQQTNARLIDQRDTPTSRMLARCPRPWHGVRTEPCPALHWPAKTRLEQE
ncbi:MAG TPA: hypothetical protein VK062_07850 [Burkholderiaceae bacterium]|nr:hypothetical protein [Burkholderiaceae bacterium]